MSWFAEIAGRAENILNNIDKNTANVLQQTSIRLGEEWSTSKTHNSDNKTDKKLNIENDSLNNLTKLNNTFTAEIEPLIKNGKVNNKANSSNAKILSLNCSEERREIIKLNIGEPPKETNYVNENLCDNTTTSKIESTISGDDTRLSDIVKDDLCDIKDEVCDIKEDLKLNQLEEKLESEKKLLNMLSLITTERDKLANQVTDLSTKNNIYKNTISEQEINLKKSQKKYMEVNEKLSWQTKETEQIRSELDKYRKKAQNALQIKDKIIEQFKSNSNENQLCNSSSITYNENIVQFENHSLREENSMKTNKLQDKIDELQKQKNVIKELNKKIIELNSTSQESIISLTNRFKSEQKKSIHLESQIKVINQEINAMRQEFNRQNQSFSHELHQKENEILMLQSKATKISEISELNSTEGKIKSLTEVLFEKQTAIENLTVEKNALKLQLEKVQEQLHYMISMNRPQRTQIINVNDTDDDKSQLPLIMKETPFDTQVARRVKRAYTSFDSAGIRIGVFLRRYPLVRILVFAYIALLHIWVMFVLLSSTPT